MDGTEASKRDEDLVASLKELKSDDELYQYAPLNASVEIRILHLKPAQSTGVELQCSLESVSLSSPPQYEALSYTWGKPVFDHTIYHGSRVLRVTANLHAALVALRHADKTRALWIDAVCINQRDLEEKAAQVAQMAEVYKQAERVVVWLGIALEGLEPPLSRLKDISDAAEGLGLNRIDGPSMWFSQPTFPGTGAEAA